MDGNNAAYLAGHAPQSPPVALLSTVSLTPLAASSVTSVNSTSTLQPGHSRASYRRDSSGLRSYSSLQDFSSYRVFPATTLDASAYQDSGDSLEKASNSSQVLRGLGLPPRVTKGGLGKSGSATGGLSPLLSPAAGASWCLRGHAVVLLLLFLSAMFFVAYHWNFYVYRKEQLRFAVVIDCGSTGTRVHVYGWARSLTAGKASLPVMLQPADNQQKSGGAYRRMETGPGLHHLAHNESGVKAAVEPLLNWAAKLVPASVHVSTPIFVLATAGLRRLPDSESRWVLDRVWSLLESSSFLCNRKWVRIISGVEEASYGWLALNYNRDRLGHGSDRPTFGALDLGGSSLEITFEPQETPPLQDAVNLSVGTVEHHLYAHSHEGFGLNDAFEKSIALLLRTGKRSSIDVVSDQDGPVEVRHPCLHAGYHKTYAGSSRYLSPSVWNAQRAINRNDFKDSGQSIQVDLVGDPNWRKCADIAAQVLNFARFADPPTACNKSSCALGRHQPEPRGKFYALSGFFVVYKFFGLSPDCSLKELLQKARKYCVLNWEDARSSVEPQTSIEQYCFRAPYVVALLRTGLHLTDEQIIVDSGGFAWTLGAALLEAAALESNNQEDPRGLERQSELSWTLGSFRIKGFIFLLLVATVLLVFVASICPRSWIMWQRRRSCILTFMQSPNNQSGCLPRSWGAIFSPAAAGKLSSSYFCCCVWGRTDL